MKWIITVALRFIACLSLSGFAASTQAQNAPPKAPVREITDDYFGLKVVDPYRWMEDMKALEFVVWMRAQNDYTRLALDRIPYRAKLLARINELSNAGAQSPQIRETAVPYACVFPNSPFVIGIVTYGVQNEMTIYAASLSDLAKETMAWRKLVDTADEITKFDVHGDEIYLLSHKNASRFKLLRVSLAKPDLTRAEVVVPPSEAVITDMRAAKDALYVQLLDGSIGRLLRAPYGGKPEALKASYDGRISDLNADVRQPGVVFALESWTKSPLWFAYEPATKRMADMQLSQPSPIDYSGIESVEVKARSYDGTLVPLSIVYKKDLKRDGTNPTLLLGYGAYGISLDPRFSPTLLAWLERGGVFAVAHVRGGGEYGEDWHKAGYKATKMNTIRDFIACAEYLVNERYTSAKRLAGQGRSAGGILIGGAITQRPGLFAASVSNVGVSDMLRAMNTPAGLMNIPEFGSVKTKEGFDALYAMSSYHHVKDGVAYPAALLTTGLNDPRVEPWQVAKMAARLQTATTSERPILLRIDYDAGHGIGSTKQQINEDLADTYAFLFQQLGGATQ